ncbi:MAG: dihydropteroate synthase [Verrucomicrobiae bacterium]|nr:dihydropteroate synthase [Verrucomicrobiae bacterium]MCP5538982.1 dihydropteroate synthase [Akkermansiaceae bacterium]MCP5550631.1 dihydropteroate synthase [Akkermansiaceae bacterium]
MENPPDSAALLWQCRGHRLDLAPRGEIMAILNVTPDSFSDGGDFLDPARAIQRGLEMLDQGAALLDIGGESTRPGAEPVPEDRELHRVLPVIQGILARRPRALVSIDTMKAPVAEAALAVGASIVNDVTALRGDPRMAEVVARSGAGVVLMHMLGTPRTMQRAPRYTDVVAEVAAFFSERLATATAAGIDPAAIVLDPGIGFGKTLEHNLALLRHLDRLAAEAARPLLLGVSRKSFIPKMLGAALRGDEDNLGARSLPTAVITALARQQGVRLHRVHEVPPNLAALRTAEALQTTAG